MKDIEDVRPIRTEAEYRQVLEAISALSAEPPDEERERRLLALRQRVQAYEQRQRIDPERLRALEELAAQAQELKMGYD